MKNTINTILIQEVVKNLCFNANIYLSKDVYTAFYNSYLKEINSKPKNILAQILMNAKLAAEFQRPLCQDTGIVVVFLEIGQNVILEGQNIEDAINQAVADSYKENYFRKSVVNCPYGKRENTKDNTPVVIHTQIVAGDEVKISVAIKGGGSENMSALKMLKPFDGEEGILEFAVQTVKNAGVKACPPIRIGIGVGGSMEQSAVLAKKALFEKIKPLNEFSENLESKIWKSINELKIGPMGAGGDFTCYGVNILSTPCHIASLPVAININCHSSRHASCVISENGINYNNEDFEYDFAEIPEINSNIKEVKLNDFEVLRSLKEGEEVYLTGTVYTARDAAHKKFVEMIEKHEKLPFDIKNQIIFYTGPCPAKPDELIGPTGPTSSSRMDKFAPILYDNGIFATIGKGEISSSVIKAIKKNQGMYFSTTGGAAVLFSKKIKQAEIIAFPKLGAEAVYKLYIEKIPAVVAIDSHS